MIGRARLLPPRKFNSPACPWIQFRFYRLTRNLRSTGPISPRTKLGLSLASFLGLVTIGLSWSQLNLDTSQDSPATRDNPREHRRHVCDDLHHVYIRRPHTSMQTSEKTVFPGDHTGVARYDTAQLGSTPYVRYLLTRFPGDSLWRLILTSKETTRQTLQRAHSPCPLATGLSFPCLVQRIPVPSPTEQYPGCAETSSPP